MPSMPVANNISRQVFGLSFIDTRGRTRSTSMRLGIATALTAATAQEYANVRGDLSNAGIYEERITAETGVTKTNAFAFDESESSVDTVLVVIWENGLGERIEDVIPAPDRSILTEDGLGLIVGDIGAALSTPARGAAEYREKIATMLGLTNGGTWAVARSYVSSYKGRGARGGVTQPQTSEPLALARPGDDPAV